MVASSTSHESTTEKPSFLQVFWPRPFYTPYLTTQGTHYLKKNYMTNGLVLIWGHDLAFQGTFICSNVAKWKAFCSSICSDDYCCVTQRKALEAQGAYLENRMIRCASTFFLIISGDILDADQTLWASLGEKKTEYRSNIPNKWATWFSSSYLCDEANRQPTHCSMVTSYS